MTMIANPHSPTLSDEWLTRLAESGYRLTEPRRAIVDVMVASEKALDPVNIFDLGRRTYPAMGLVTVYRTLEKLEELGLVQRVHHPGGCHMYLRSGHGHEHLLLCTSCGRAEYFSGDDLTGLMETISTRSGFKIREHWLQLFGLCQQCKNS
jgi:Fur family ferric uptake transcriptional regulator